MVKAQCPEHTDIMKEEPLFLWPERCQTIGVAEVGINKQDEDANEDDGMPLESSSYHAHDSDDVIVMLT